MNRAIAAAAALLLVASPLSAQSPPTGGPAIIADAHTRGVLAGGVSFAGAGEETSAGIGFGGHVGLRHQRGSYVLSARAGMNGGGSAYYAGAGGLIDRFDELAALLGYVVGRSENAQTVLSVGLAAVSGERVVTGEGEFREVVDFGPTVGVPIEMAISGPGPGSGFGLVVHANLNAEEVFGAVLVTYLIGF